MCSYSHCVHVVRTCRWSKVWSTTLLPKLKSSNHQAISRYRVLLYCRYYTTASENMQEVFSKTQKMRRSSQRKRLRKKVEFVSKNVWTFSSFEQCTRVDKRLKELLKLVARNREELDGSLTEKQKETLEKFEDCMNEMHSIPDHRNDSKQFSMCLSKAEKWLDLFTFL